MSKSANKSFNLRLNILLKFLIFIVSIRNVVIDHCIDILRYCSIQFFLFDHPNYARSTIMHLVNYWDTKQEN